MKNTKGKFSRGLASFFAVTSLSLGSCNWDEAGTESESDYNNGRGRENFSVYSGIGQTYGPESSVVIVEVLPRTAYDIGLTCYNDGDADRIDMVVDGKKVESYVTLENRHGGMGWYEPQFIGPARVISVGNTMRLEAKVLSTDRAYGVDVDDWTVSRVDNQ